MPTNYFRLIMIAAALSISLHSVADNKKTMNGDYISYRGNIFEFSKSSSPDTVTVVDSESGEEALKIAVRVPSPLKMNGSKIYKEKDISDMKSNGKPALVANIDNTAIFEYLLKNIGAPLTKLSNGKYQMYINHIIIDSNGKIVYYDFSGLNWDKVKITQALQDEIITKVEELINTYPAGKPATVDGVSVVSWLEDIAFYFTIKNGKVDSMY